MCTNDLNSSFACTFAGSLLVLQHVILTGDSSPFLSPRHRSLPIYQSCWRAWFEHKLSSGSGSWCTELCLVSACCCSCEQHQVPKVTLQLPAAELQTQVYGLVFSLSTGALIFPDYREEEAEDILENKTSSVTLCPGLSSSAPVPVLMPAANINVWRLWWPPSQCSDHKSVCMIPNLLLLLWQKYKKILHCDRRVSLI